MSPDDIARCLEVLRDADLLDREEGDLEEHGTTEDLWVTTDNPSTGTDGGQADE